MKVSERVYVAMSDSVRRQILVILQGGAVGHGGLMESLCVEKQVLTYAMSRLLDVGLVVCERDGRSKVYELTDAGKGVASAIEIIEGIGG